MSSHYPYASGSSSLPRYNPLPGDYLPTSTKQSRCLWNTPEEVGHLQNSGDSAEAALVLNEIKDKGVFDKFRRDCLADVETLRCYSAVKKRVERHVEHFLTSGQWPAGTTKNQLREKLRTHLQRGDFLQAQIQILLNELLTNERIYQNFFPEIQRMTYSHLNIPLKLDDQGIALEQSANETSVEEEQNSFSMQSEFEKRKAGVRESLGELGVPNKDFYGVDKSNRELDSKEGQSGEGNVIVEDELSIDHGRCNAFNIVEENNRQSPEKSPDLDEGHSIKDFIEYIKDSEGNFEVLEGEEALQYVDDSGELVSLPEGSLVLSVNDVMSSQIQNGESDMEIEDDDNSPLLIDAPAETAVSASEKEELIKDEESDSDYEFDVEVQRQETSPGMEDDSKINKRKQRKPIKRV